MHHHEELVCLDRQFVLNDAVLWNTDAVESRTDGAQASNYRGALQRSHDPRHHGTRSQHRTDAWNKKEGRSEQQSPDASPEGAGLAPVLHPVAGVVITDRVFVGMRIFADDGQSSHVGPCALKFLNRFFRFDMRTIDGNYCVLFRHFLSPYVFRVFLWHVKTFAEFLKPVRKHLLELTGQPDQLTLVFDAGSSSRRNLEDMQHYVTAVRPSSHLALLEEAARELSEVQLTSGITARAWRTSRVIAGKRREVVVVFSSKLHAGQLRGLHQTLSKSWREFEEMGSFARTTVETAKRKLEKTPQTPVSALLVLLQDRSGWNKANPGLGVDRLAGVSTAG